MKSLKFLAFSLVFLFALSSCNKEDVTEVIDKTPVVTPEESNGDQILALNAAAFTIDDAVLVEVKDEDGNLMNYSLSLGSAGINVGGAVYVLGWSAPDGETSIQETDYDGDGAATISQDGLDEVDAWDQNGADPDAFPDLSDDIIFYFATGTTINIANLTGDSADVTLGGTMEDENGNQVAVSGTFTATIE